MDPQEIAAFLELSVLLTGLGPSISQQRKTAGEYARVLLGTYPVKFPALLDAYKALASALPKPALDDALLDKLKQTQAFKDNLVVARQIVLAWYLSHFNDETPAPAGPRVVDAGFFEQGAVWPLIGAHPVGFSAQPHGYWTKKP